MYRTTNIHHASNYLAVRLMKSARPCSLAPKASWLSVPNLILIVGCIGHAHWRSAVRRRSSRLLFSRFSPCVGLVSLRQTFVHCCQNYTAGAALDTAEHPQFPKATHLRRAPRTS